MCRKINKKNGFGIIEVLLASLVIIIVLGGLVFLAHNSVTNTAYRLQHSQATFLAQEGIEIVRQIRDTNYIDGDSNTKWNTLYFVSGGPVPINGMIGGSYQVQFDAVSNKYKLATGFQTVNIEGTEFNRKIQVRQVTANVNNIFQNNADMIKNAYVVDCIVTWTSTRGGRAEVKVTEMMTNSRQGL